MGVPQNRWFIMETPNRKRMIWGVPRLGGSLATAHRRAWIPQGPPERSPSKPGNWDT